MKSPHLVLLPALLLVAAAPAQGFVNYESPQVHPIAASADGQRLFAVNTPDNRLAVFGTADPRRPVLLREVFVGLEPVSVRPRTKAEVWVVCHLSDSIAVVDVDAGVVTATIRVPDEPADVAFAGGRAFVSVSGSDEVRVFDPVSHKELATIPVFGEEPRNLLASADGKTVWAVVHRSGNDTTVLPAAAAPPPPRPTNRRLPAAPQVGLVIDSEDPQWTGRHSVVLPDFDLVEIDVATLAVRRSYVGVGTINAGAAQRPGTGEVWVANTDARNTVRFVTNLRGHAFDNRVTRVVTGAVGSVTPFDLNPGIDYTTLPNPAALASALAQPVDVAWDAAGKNLYVAAFGTDRIGVVDGTGKVTGLIEVGNTPGTRVDPRNKRGPRGLALHPGGVLFVLNRLANSLSVVDPAAASVVVEIPMFDPTPQVVRQGRGFLYDAKLSGNGTFSCGSCHVDGDTDGLAWDLGDPGGDMFNTQTGPVKIALHPMKGPMLTQTLKGLLDTGPFHWRGDKPTLQDFNGAFDSLMGGTKLPSTDMDDYAAFLQTIAFPPNPHRTLTDELPSQSARDGENLFRNVPFTGAVTCVSCHVLPTGTNRLVIPATVLQANQAMKTAQLRNVYKRFGFRSTAQGRKSGVGFTHDGEKQDILDFLSLPVFNRFSNDRAIQLRIQDFLTAFPTGTAPAVGYQVTLDRNNATDQAVIAEVQLLQARAEAGDIDLLAKGRIDGQPRGMLYQIVQRHYLQDGAGVPPLSRSAVLGLLQAGRAVLTFTGTAPGTGRRLGLDRDADGVLDRDEGVVVYGSGTKGCAGIPSLGVSSAPRLGNGAFALTGEQAIANAPGYLAVSAAAANLPLLGITVLVDLGGAVIVPVVAGSDGRLLLSLPIPNDGQLVGLRTFSQVAWLDACGPQGLSATQGLQVTIFR